MNRVQDSGFGVLGSGFRGRIQEFGKYTEKEQTSEEHCIDQRTGAPEQRNYIVILS
jgi:hypothetical protein